jgi:PKD repeat protein
MRQYPEGRRGGPRARARLVAALLVVTLSAGLVGVFPTVASASVPVPVFAVTTASPTVGVPVSFDGSASYDPKPPDHIVLFVWSFGDGSRTATGSTPTHLYTSPGTYSVTLTVTDSENSSASAIRVVTVAPLSTPTAPVFYRSSPSLSTSPGKAYSYGFAATGYPAPTYALTGAPAWLSVVAGTGVVSGIPTSGTNSFSFSVVASDGVSPSPAAGPFHVTVSTVSGGAGLEHGYWLVGSDGGIFSFGSAGFYGSTGSFVLQRPVVGISPTGDRKGYWLVASDGGIFAFGDAGYYGSLPGLGFSPAGSAAPFPLAAPIVAMVPSTDGAGYFMIASDGGIFAFGDARFAGSCPGIGGCAGPAVAVMPDASGNGYWLVTSTGNVYAFGDAAYLGAPTRRSVPVTSAVRTPDGGGYWILYADGKVVPFGDAGAHGDSAGTLGSDTATAIVATSDGGGYWVTTASGAVDPFGDAPKDGSMAGAHLNAPIVAASGW